MNSMKHPHCNRSRAAHLFWCRGFAPLVFILAIALIVVSIGSGIYFAFTKKTAQAPSPQEGATLAIADLNKGVSSSPPASTSSERDAGNASQVAASAVVDCGSTSKEADRCMAEHIKTCAPAKGIFTDSSSELTVERIIDGYKGSACSYRTTIISGAGELGVLTGMEIDCMLPKNALSVTVRDGVMSQDDMLAYCTGSFIDLMREQMGL